MLHHDNLLQKGRPSYNAVFVNQWDMSGMIPLLCRTKNNEQERKTPGPRVLWHDRGESFERWQRDAVVSLTSEAVQSLKRGKIARRKT